MLVLSGGPPHLHGVAAPGLGEAPQQRRHVADVVGVQVRQEDLGRRRDRQAETVEVGQRARPQVEEEEVTLRIADLDQQRRRRLALLHERVTAAEDRHSDLVGCERLRSGHVHVCVLPSGSADHRRRRQRHLAAVVRQLGQLVDLHHQLRSFVVRTPVSPLFASTVDHITDPRIRHMGVDRRPTLRPVGRTTWVSRPAQRCPGGRTGGVQARGGIAPATAG